MCCENSCDVTSCEKRHPRNCFWFGQFTYCAYKHSEKEINKDLKGKADKLEKMIKEKVDEMKRQNLKLMEIDRNIKEKDDEIKSREKKILEIEAILRENELINKRLMNLEKFVLLLQEKAETNEKEDHKITRWNPVDKGWTSLDPLVRRDSSELKCEKCDYVGRNSARLKLHMEVKHMNICTLCNHDCIFETRDELQKHNSMVHENLDDVLTQEQFENLSDGDLKKLRGNNTPRSRDVSKKYNLRQKQLNFK